jgi:EAL domain-containing protein (putative c-di-GMP-specific phosphodiesterase class I)
MGIAVYPNDARDSEKLLQFADTAMYSTKKSGGNGFSFFSESMNTDIKERVKVKNELRSALENNRLRLYFQPVYNVSTGEFDRAEALVRWHHEERGVILPSEFIPMAEHSDLIRDMDLWVFERVVEYLKNNPSELSGLTSISINASSSVLNSPLYESMLKGAVDVLGRIEFESSEVSGTKNGRHGGRAIDFISRHGGRISIDDFGSGLSSLAHLQSAPVNTIKIGKQFVDGITESDESCEIIDAMVAIAKAIGAEIVASGVENEAQVQYLSKFENMHLQGFYYSKPLPYKELAEFLVKGKYSEIKKAKGAASGS